MPRGGTRAGAGRPVGAKNTEYKPTRPNKTMRAFDDEWELIRRAAKLIKKKQRDKGRNDPVY